jgi:hypothetical protein
MAGLKYHATTERERRAQASRAAALTSGLLPLEVMSSRIRDERLPNGVWVAKYTPPANDLDQRPLLPPAPAQ